MLNDLRSKKQNKLARILIAVIKTKNKISVRCLHKGTIWDFNLWHSTLKKYNRNPLRIKILILKYKSKNYI